MSDWFAGLLFYVVVIGVSGTGLGVVAWILLEPARKRQVVALAMDRNDQMHRYARYLYSYQQWYQAEVHAGRSPAYMPDAPPI